MRRALPLVVVLMALVAVPAARAADGDLDPSWGDHGVVKTADITKGETVVVQPDRKVVVGGDPGWTLRRFNVDGSADGSFQPEAVPNGALVLDSDLAPDGGILTAGSQLLGGTTYLAAVAKHTSTGALDTGFGTGGVAQPASLGTLNAEFGAVAVTGDKIVAVGDAYATGPQGARTYSLLVARFDLDGQPDLAFGLGGRVLVSVTASDSTAFAYFHDVVFVPNGDLIVVGFAADTGFNYQVTLVRLDAGGNPVNGFGTGGVAKAAPPGTTNGATAYGGALVSGKLLTLGWSQGPAARSLLAGRFNPDTGKSENLASITYGAFSGYRYGQMGVTYQPDGKGVVAGVTYDSGSQRYSYLTARFLPDGTGLDPTFGNQGAVTTDLTGLDDARAVAYDAAGGKLVVAGESGYDPASPTPPQAAIIRMAALNAPPVAAVSGLPAKGPAPLPVVFDTSGTRDPDGPLASWTLDFADGSAPLSGEGNPPVGVGHTYVSQGRYHVVLTVVDRADLSAQASTDIEVGPPGSGQPGRVFYFAEGTVRPGFVEYLTLQNPSTATIAALIEFQASDDTGAPMVMPSDSVSLAPASRVTVNVNDFVASRGFTAPLNISAKVSAPSDLVAERPLYFKADPALGEVVDGGTDIVGATSLSTTLYFAEGTVRPGFVEYLTLQNPNPGAVGTTLRFQATDDAGHPVLVPDASVPIPAQSRATFNLNAYLAGAGFTEALNVSVKAEATAPILAERPIYFRADPALGEVVDGAHDVVGSPGLAQDYHFAEGTLRPHFVEYVVLQNPSDEAGTATLSFRATRTGSAVPTPPLTQTVAGGSRVTVNITQALADRGLGGDVDLAVDVSLTAPILAERPIYFQADPGLGQVVNGGHDVVGVSTLSTSYAFAEGTVRPGFVEYLTFGNPGPVAASATLTFQVHYDSGSGPVVNPVVQAVPAGGRATVRVADYVTGPADVSVKITSDVGLVVERPMYFARDPALGAVVNGGTDAVGFPG